MFETAETGAKLSDAAFRHARGHLRLDLVKLQQRNRLDAKFPVIVLLSGVRGGGIVDTLNLLDTWMDPRWIKTYAFEPPNEEERKYPAFWRYWRTLPGNGTMGLYLGGWYADALTKRSAEKTDDAAFATSLRQIASFERTLTEEGALVVKIWLHLSKATHAKTRHEHALDATFGFRSSDAVIPEPADYDAYIKVAAAAIKATQTDGTPWHIIDGSDDNFRRASALTILRNNLQSHFKRHAAQKKANAKAIKRERKQAAKQLKHDKKRKRSGGRLAKVPLDKTLTAAQYQRAFAALQARVYAAQQEARALGLATVVMFEGWDAAGKGGAVRRLTYCLNARNYQVAPIAAPNDEELAHHFLWRFWRALQPAGHVTIFDRSWYGRVLVERVDNLIPETTWRRAYGEINDFEKQLTTRGDVLLKFWLHIDRHTQRARFEEREETPYKQWKITEDDWHNRKRWGLYADAAEEMFTATSRPDARWQLVPADDKRYARIFILRKVATAMERAIRSRQKTLAARRTRVQVKAKSGASEHHKLQK